MRFLANREKRSFLIQLVLAVILIAISFIIVQNVRDNLAAVGIRIDFGFLSGEAGFDVNESLIAYSASDSYARVLLVGLLNTLQLSIVCIVAATLIGVVMGIIRAGNNWLGTRLALAYVELLRNLPKLLILLAVFIIMVNRLPVVRKAWNLFDGIYISNRAFYFPTLIWTDRMSFVLVALFIWLVAAIFWTRHVHYHQDLSGKRLPVGWPMIGSLLAMLLLVSGLFNISYHFSTPILKGFDFVGGGRLSVQFVALAITLSIYHGGQITELVRGGIQSVSKSQLEAADALGLRSGQITRLVVLPQALRMIIPPLGNQYLNLIKNTSIALAIGYSDLVSVMSTSINQTFRPIELMSITMMTYLAISLVVTALLNWFNARTKIVGN
ncbi:MAG: amino acid ABC transporter permease [Deltaproteobacteria bacterium]|nr:MAG: amino acid ABC transporter permease [Deltaproteobacteria bacterium]